MIGEILFLVLCWGLFGLCTAVVVLGDDAPRLVDFLGVVFWWPLFIVKGFLMVIVWIAKNLHIIVVNGFTILIGGQRATQKRRW